MINYRIQNLKQYENVKSNHTTIITNLLFLPKRAEREGKTHYAIGK